MNALRKSVSIIALAGLWTTAAWGQLAISQPVAAIDNIPPASVSELKALDASADGAPNIVLTWKLSVDDAISFSPFGGGVVPRGDVRGYRVYRQNQGQEDATLIGTVGSGVSRYIDRAVKKGESYVYSVRPFDLDNETRLSVVPGSAEDLARIVTVGGGRDVVVVTKVRGRMTFDSNLDLNDQRAVDSYVVLFVDRLSAELGINRNRVTILVIRRGSVVIEFEIAEPAAGSTEPKAAAALTTLQSAVSSGTRAFEALGAVQALQDISATIIQPSVKPLDAAGNIVLGWFTFQGDRVSFDDFFLFADHFGRKEGDAGYNALFDIVANGRIDFEDFFRFADDFGKIVVNADQVRSNRG